MNRTTLLTLYRYNAFANELLFETLDQLEGVDLLAESPSRDSIINLLHHSLMVETIYLQMAEKAAIDRANIPDDIDGIITGLRAISVQQAAYFENVTDEMLSEERTWAGVTLPIGELMMQCVLHSLQHRSEITLLLSQQGYSLPDFDILKFFIHESGQEWPF